MHQQACVEALSCFEVKPRQQRRDEDAATDIIIFASVQFVMML